MSNNLRALPRWVILLGTILWLSQDSPHAGRVASMQSEQSWPSVQSVETGDPVVQVDLSNRTLRKTHMQFDASNLNFSAGQSPVMPPLSISCPGTTTCTLEFTAVMQVGGGDPPDRDWGLGVAVDGSLFSGVAGNFFTVGRVTSNLEQRATQLFKTGVTPGSHGVQLHISTTASGVSVYRSLVVRVYRP
jgi:hypothetical protein